MLTLQSSPGPASTGVTESRGKFVAGERRFSGLFPMPPRRPEKAVETAGKFLTLREEMAAGV